jgi:hypothetical protein
MRDITRSVSRTVALALVAFLTILAGCGGTGGVATTGPETPTTGSSTATDAPTTPTTEPCTASSLEYDVAIPERPSPLTASAAEELVKEFELERQRSYLRATSDTVSIDQWRYRESATQKIEEGYEVRVTLRIAFTADGQIGDREYETVYRVMERRLVRDGRTLACWGSGSS